MVLGNADLSGHNNSFDFHEFTPHRQLPVPRWGCHSERSAAESKNLLLAFLARGWETKNPNGAQAPSAPPQVVVDHYPHLAHTINKQSKSAKSTKSKGETMRNITVAVSDDSYRQARIWAAKNDTSVSAVVQDLLLNLAGLARVARTFTAGLPTSASRPNSTPEKE
jgi:hypothetical protein